MSQSIVVVGSCMIDFSSYTARLPLPGETLCGTKFERSYGGKGANQCVTAARLGASTSLVASLGSDVFGAEYLELLKSENVNVSHVKVKQDISSGTAQILVADSGENSIVIVMGANALLSTADVDAAADTIKTAAVLLCQFESCIETTLYALKLHKGHGISILNGAPAVENPDPQLLKTCDVFCVNETEAELMTGIRPLTLSNAQEAVDCLLDKGCNTVILTLGAAGAVYASQINGDRRKIVHVSTEKVSPVDTTACIVKLRFLMQLSLHRIFNFCYILGSRRRVSRSFRLLHGLSSSIVDEGEHKKILPNSYTERTEARHSVELPIKEATSSRMVFISACKKKQRI